MRTWVSALSQSSQRLGEDDPYLDEELVPPAVERLKALGRVDVVNEHAAVGPAVKGDAERLEALLAGRVPELRRRRARSVVMSRG
jgi:hypothetical protein